MDKRKKYFCVVAVVLILLSGYGKISDSAFQMQVTRMIAGEKNAKSAASGSSPPTQGTPNTAAAMHRGTSCTALAGRSAI